MVFLLMASRFGKRIYREGADTPVSDGFEASAQYLINLWFLFHRKWKRYSYISFPKLKTVSDLNQTLFYEICRENP